MTAKSLSDLMDFDHVIEVKPDGSVVDGPRGLYAPDLYDGELPPESGWTLLDGYSGQDHYRGPIMHNSEFIGGRMERDILSQPGYYVALVCHWLDTPEGDDDIEGWAVAHKPTESEG
jgi:hypothetical protein